MSSSLPANFVFCDTAKHTCFKNLSPLSMELPLLLLILQLQNSDAAPWSSPWLVQLYSPRRVSGAYHPSLQNFSWYHILLFGLVTMKSHVCTGCVMLSLYIIRVRLLFIMGGFKSTWITLQEALLPSWNCTGRFPVNVNASPSCTGVIESFWDLPLHFHTLLKCFNLPHFWQYCPSAGHFFACSCFTSHSKCSSLWMWNHGHLLFFAVVTTPLLEELCCLGLSSFLLRLLLQAPCLSVCSIFSRNWN